MSELKYKANETELSGARWALAVVALYMLACALPALGQADIGLRCLFAVPFVCFYPAWWANLALVAGLVGYGYRKWMFALTLGIFAAALAASLLLPRLREPNWVLLPGYYVWLASMLIFLLATVRVYFDASQNRGRGKQDS